MTARGRIALATLLAAVYAGCYSAIKLGLDFAPPLRFAGLRALLAGLALLALVAVRREPLLPPRRLWPAVLAIALAEALSFGAMFLSPGRTGAGLASVLGNTGPLVVIILAALFLGEPITRGKLSALALGLVGVGLIMYPDPTRATAAAGSFVLLLPLVASASSASASIVVKRAQMGGVLLRVTAWQFLVGCLPLLIASTWTEHNQRIRWTPEFMTLLGFLAFAGTAFATALWYWLIQRDEVGRLTLVLYLVPVFGLLLAFALFGEKLDALEAAGIGLVLTGIGAVVYEAWRQPAVKARVRRKMAHRT